MIPRWTLTDFTTGINKITHEVWCYSITDLHWKTLPHGVGDVWLPSRQHFTATHTHLRGTHRHYLLTYPALTRLAARLAFLPVTTWSSLPPLEGVIVPSSAMLRLLQQTPTLSLICRPNFCYCRIVLNKMTLLSLSCMYNSGIICYFLF
jgi:hypothetical protein